MGGEDLVPRTPHSKMQMAASGPKMIRFAMNAQKCQITGAKDEEIWQMRGQHPRV